jgi:hypothetical protein
VKKQQKRKRYVVEGLGDANELTEHAGFLFQRGAFAKGVGVHLVGGGVSMNELMRLDSRFRGESVKTKDFCNNT